MLENQKRVDTQSYSPVVRHAKRVQYRPLSGRELQILQLIVDGMSCQEIANDLELSVNTVAKHRVNIMDALGVRKTSRLIVHALRNGLARL